MPQGHSSNVKSLVLMQDFKLIGLKSHDCHILIQQLLLLEYMALNEKGGELFKESFRKLFQLEQNPLYETQSEIQFAKI